ncbi:hypothetical protein [Desulfolutivibrio sp.]|uniref:hypothetical protein n=1 Tax=Desulfolutivibrio sp. TaxID=2773296 RepID=UPI002F963252
MDWKLIPRDAEYFAGDADEEYFICARGLVIEGRFLEGGDPNLEKAIWPTVQGNRAYIRIRRKGLDKKFQLTRILADLFPEVCLTEVVIETRKGPWSLSGETGKRGRAEAAGGKEKPRARAVKAAGKADGAVAAGRGEKVSKAAKPEQAERGERADLQDEELPGLDPLLDVQEEDDDDLIAESRELRACKVCNLKKRVQEFSPRDDMCMDCYMGRDELLKEIMAKKRRKAKVFQPRIVEEGDDPGMAEGVDGLERIEYGISVSE